MVALAVISNVSGTRSSVEPLPLHSQSTVHSPQICGRVVDWICAISVCTQSIRHFVFALHVVCSEQSGHLLYMFPNQESFSSSDIFFTARYYAIGDISRATVSSFRSKEKLIFSKVGPSLAELLPYDDSSPHPGLLPKLTTITMPQTRVELCTCKACERSGEDNTH